MNLKCYKSVILVPTGFPERRRAILTVTNVAASGNSRRWLQHLGQARSLSD
jgi:hypothetical protein